MAFFVFCSKGIAFPGRCVGSGVVSKTCPKLRASPFEVDQVGQVQTSRKSMNKGSWPPLLTLPTFFRRVGGSRRFDATLRISDTTERRLGMESGALEDRERPNVFGEVDQVGQVQTSRKSMKKGSWPTLLTLPTFFRRVGGPRRLDATLRNSDATESRLGLES